jgi:2-dehydro-3-deoxygluconokinase
MKAEVVTLGEVLMRLSPKGNSRFVQAQEYDVLYAGSEANVAASLAVFGVPSAHVTCLPDNDLGISAANTLRQYGLDTSCIVHKEGRLGLYFIENGSSIRSPKIIYDRFDSAFANLDPSAFDWEAILDGASWFHWSGITPAISLSAAIACGDAINAARKKGITVSGDINYRRNLWQYGKTAREIMPGLIESCDVLVAGITDFENCLGIGGDSFEEACAKVMKQYPAIKKVFTSTRSTVDSSRQILGGIVWNGKQILRSREYDLTPIVDRVGSGDAFMAGIIFAQLNRMDAQHTIDFATAAAALKHTVEGDVNIVSVEEVNAVVKGENVGKLLR